MTSVVDDFDVCAICLLDLLEPRQLPCGHVFCTTCLQEEIDHHIKTSLSSDFVCPSCSETVKQIECPVNQSDWAKMFPLMDKTSLPLKENRSVESTSEKLQLCSQHQNFTKNIFCKDCCKIICQKCSDGEHLSCSKVLSLENAVAVVDENLVSYLEEIKEEEENLKLVYPDLLSVLRKSTESVEDDVAVAREMIKKTSRQLIETVRNQEEALLKELDRHYKVERRKLEKYLAVFNNLNTAMTKITSLQKSKKDLRFLQQAEILAQELFQTKMDVSKFQGFVKPEVKFVPDEHSLLTFNLGSIEVILSE